jgi:hypothetical protein
MLINYATNNGAQMVKKPRGGSGTNPYLADRKLVSYTEVIEPLSLGRRVLEVRAKLAEDLAQVCCMHYTAQFSTNFLLVSN